MMHKSRSLNLQFTDPNGHESGEAVSERHRGATRGHYEAGEQHPRTARHVHGHGHACGVPGNCHSIDMSMLVESRVTAITSNAHFCGCILL